MDHVPHRSLVTTAGATVPLPDQDRLTHLQFRRFAGCPVCHLHLRSVVRRHDEIRAAGIREIVVFHAPAAELRPYVADLPFDVLADPDRALYREFGVESAPRALSDPRAWPAILRAVAHALPDVILRRRPAPPARPSGGRLGLPADFLIAPGGAVVASKYDQHADDQWSVDELLALAVRS